MSKVQMSVVDRENKRRWTFAAIAAHNEAMGYFCFTRDTMQRFGDARKNWNVICRHGDVFLKRTRTIPGREGAHGDTFNKGELRVFNPATGEIGPNLAVEGDDGWRKHFPHPLG